MNLSASGCFHIDSLLSLRPPGSLPPRLDPPELRPLPPPRREAPLRPPGSLPPRLDPPELRPLPPPRREAPLRPRCASSFLIRDILADRRSCPHPGQRSDPVLESSDPVQAEMDPRAQEDFQDENVDSLSPDSRTRGPGRGPVRLKKVRKARTAFSDQQLTRLERSFQNQKYLSVQDRMALAAALQLSDTQVKTWYQNRRTKWKRQSAVGLELLAGAGRMFLPMHLLFPPAPPTLDLYLYREHAHHTHQATPRPPQVLTHHEGLHH